jgi:hypothetical protein
MTSWETVSVSGRALFYGVWQLYPEEKAVSSVTTWATDYRQTLSHILEDLNAHERCTKNLLLAIPRLVSPFIQATKALRESRGIAILCFYTSALEGGEGSASSPDRFLPPGKTRYPLYRRLGGPQGRYGQVRKISPPPGFGPGPSSP